MSEPAAGTRLIVGPFNRVEGDLEVRLTVEDGRVARAEVVSTLFRGFERMLAGRDPMDALIFVPRICGICSVSQSVAAARALADLAGHAMPANGERALNLIHAAENAADHLTHFNLFFMPDLTRPAYEGRDWHATACSRFAAGAGTSVRTAVEIRARLLHVMGVLAGHWPHSLAIQPGGVTKAPSPADRVRLMSIASAFRRDLERHVFGGDLREVVGLTDHSALSAWCADHPDGDVALFHRIAADLDFAALGCDTSPLMSAGAYELAGRPVFAAGMAAGGALGRFVPAAIREDASHAFLDQESARHPFNGVTVPDIGFAAPAYTFCKAPRLDGVPVEVGALARQVVDRQPLIHDLYLRSGANVFSRVTARLIELARLSLLIEELARDIDPAAAFYERAGLPKDGRGQGFCEAARGTLGHWIVVEKGRIANYQIIAPTTWNFSPRDEGGAPGPLERALVGTPVPAGDRNPVAVQHIVRSYDPCMVCTVH